MKEYIVPIDDDSSNYDEMFVGHIREYGIEIVRCGECRFKPIEEEYTHKIRDKYGFPEKIWVETIVKSPVDFSPCPCIQDDEYYSWVPDDDWFCANGRKK